ncbi:MAG: hypothetical protein JWQ21_2942 [Herminiimonas sp.]|nr:hypothetical protein [Herminiimonas sp.]
MTKNQTFLKRYVLQQTPKQTTKQVAERVAAVINDSTVKSTEVIRQGRFVYGRVSPVPKMRATA